MRTGPLIGFTKLTEARAAGVTDSHMAHLKNLTDLLIIFSPSENEVTQRKQIELYCAL